MTKVAVTGGAGFIGSHTALVLLEAGHQLVVLDDFRNSSPESLRRVEQLSGKKISLVAGDICHPASLQRAFSSIPIDAVIHFAGLKAVAESVAKPLLYWQMNLEGTRLLLQAMASAGCRSLVFSSSATLYGIPDQVPIPESAAIKPINPYGHSKAEYLSAAFEGGMIFLAAIAICITAIERLINPQPITTLGIGTALTVVASLINLAIALLLLHGGKRHDSPALEGDGKHLLTDVWTTAGVVVGVAAASISGFTWLDPLVAIAVAGHILLEGGSILYKAINGLMDKALPAERINEIEQALAPYISKKVQFVNLRTRAAATIQFAQVDMQVPGDWSVEHAHQVADEAEQQLQQLGVQLSIHIEPQHAHGVASKRIEP